MVDRPKGITIWMIVELVTAIILIGFSVACFSGIAYTIYNTSIRGPLDAILAPFAGLRINELVTLMFAPGMFYVWGVLTLLLGLAFLGSAALLYMVKESGRLLSVINGCLILLTLIGIILGILMIWYFRRDKTRGYFQ